MTISAKKLAAFMAAAQNPRLQQAEPAAPKPAPNLETFVEAINTEGNSHSALLYALNVYNSDETEEAVRMLAGNTAIDIAEKITHATTDIAMLKDVSSNLFGHAQSIRHNLNSYPDVGQHGRNVRRAFSHIADKARTKASGLQHALTV